LKTRLGRCVGDWRSRSRGSNRAVFLVAYLVFLSQSFTPHKTITPEAPLKYWLLLWAIFILTLVFAKIALNELSGAIVLSGWAIGGSFALVIFVKACKKLKKPEPESMVTSYE